MIGQALEPIKFYLKGGHMFNLFNLIKNSIHNPYQANELVSREYRVKIDLRQYKFAINLVLKSLFGSELERVIVEQQFYAYKLKKRRATRKEKVQLGRMIVRKLPELIPAIKSYPLSEPELLRPCRKLFQCVKAKKRLAEIVRRIGWCNPLALVG